MAKATKTQIIKYIEKRELQARQLSRDFEKSGFTEMSDRYYGEYQLASRLLMFLQGELDMEAFLND